ncbi:type VII secretion system-associated protein [Actinoplanes sp. L3-i22]|uniref:type VII secretion system-associated protein n=1 Tax=Actinoplanes sp. L3-i22 TaxID=2836373 RepID=UPI002106E754|nr:type VII secretion system-associated protein [Actinoplanes sp. L3-i22]
MSAVRENFFVLMDPAWAPGPRDEAPPFAAVLGLWPILDHGGVGGFRTNPEYVPSGAGAPTDPIDAALLAVAGTGTGLDQVRVLLRDCLVEVGVDDSGRPLIADSPDDLPCLMVATSARNRGYAPAIPGWRTADLDDLIAVLDDDVDVLLNPGGPRMTRLTGGFVRAALGLDDAEAAALLTGAGARPRHLTVLPWAADRP